MFIDAHSHLDRYAEELEHAICEINRHQIFTISNSMDLHSYKENLRISEKSQLILPTFGIHPWNASDYTSKLEDLDNAIESSPILGEIGLDFFFVKDTTQYPAQQRVFEYFITSARKLNKIINLHTKGAEKEVLTILKNHGIQKAIIHWYSGPKNILKDMINQGFYFTIGIEVLYSQNIQDIASYIPTELLLTETDNPGGLRSLKGEKGYPVIVKDIVKKIADVRKMTIEDTNSTVRRNLSRLLQDNQWIQNRYTKLIAE